MGVNWQTGDPPCGVELLIEYRFARCEDVRHSLACKRQRWRFEMAWWDDEEIELIRWSTLDDDRAAKAMGALEKYIDSHPDDSVDLSKIDGKYVAVLSDSCGYLYADSKREGTSIIEAIEKLTATDQQTKGASDGQA